MKIAEGQTRITYQVDCPNCRETTFSNSDYEHWHKHLEFGDGKPYGEMPCPDCKEVFEISIGDEIL